MRPPFSLNSARCKGIHDGVLVQMRAALLRTLARFRPAAASGLPIVMPLDSDQAAVLRFPIRGEALLVNLAATLRERELRRRDLNGEPGDDPFVMTMSRSPRPRLSLDRDAYVDFHAEDETFHLKIDAAPVSRLTLETTEFATMVKFVLQYLAERQGEAPQREDVL